MSGSAKCIESALPMEPPADMEQNSNKPSKAGLSSPTRTIPKVSALNVSERTLETYIVSPHGSTLPLFQELLDVRNECIRRYGTWSFAVVSRALVAGKFRAQQTTQ